MSNRDEKEKLIRKYMALPYQLEIVPDGEGTFIGRFPDLPGCLTAGETEKEVIANAEDAKRAWLEAAIDSDYPIPLPLKQTDRNDENQRDGMKNVYEHLNLLDTEELKQRYVLRYKQYSKVDEEETYENNVGEFIKYLKTIEPIYSYDLVLHASEPVDETDGECHIAAITVDDYNCHCNGALEYGIYTLPQNEILGLFVGNDEYTQTHLYDVMIHVLYEASFFGYHQEHFDEMDMRDEYDIENLNPRRNPHAAILNDSTITVRLPKEKKERFQKLCADAGMSPSVAISIFISNVIERGDLSFGLMKVAGSIKKDMK